MRLVWFQSVFMSQLDGCCYHMMFNTEECEIYGGSGGLLSLMMSSIYGKPNPLFQMRMSW